MILKIKDSNLSEGLKQQLLAPNFRPESLMGSDEPPSVPLTKKADEAEKLARMSVKLKEKLLQLKKQAETTDKENPIESEGGQVPPTGSLVGQSQSRGPLLEGTENKLASSSGRDNAGNVFYDDLSSISCPQPLSHSTIAANPSISGKAVVEVGQGEGQSKREKETESFQDGREMNALPQPVLVPAPAVSTLVTHSKDVSSPRPPLPLTSARKDKGKDSMGESSACIALRHCTSKLMKVIDDLDYAIALRLKS